MGRGWGGARPRSLGHTGTKSRVDRMPSNSSCRGCNQSSCFSHSLALPHLGWPCFSLLLTAGLAFLPTPPLKSKDGGPQAANPRILAQAICPCGLLVDLFISFGITRSSPSLCLVKLASPSVCTICSCNLQPAITSSAHHQWPSMLQRSYHQSATTVTCYRLSAIC